MADDPTAGTTTNADPSPHERLPYERPILLRIEIAGETLGKTPTAMEENGGLFDYGAS